ncbi:hypothetical protein FACS1894218_6870 [Bacilli bacterium]|nr:hypothetical protein FACS1894218_6870 [Bacilli bacterium]
MNPSQIVGTVFITIGFILIGYFLGSLVFGPIIMRRYHKDIHNVGSGNPGATNVARTAGKGVGLLVACLDAAKGYVAVALCFLIYNFSIGK